MHRKYGKKGLGNRRHFVLTLFFLAIFLLGAILLPESGGCEVKSCLYANAPDGITAYRMNTVWAMEDGGYVNPETGYRVEFYDEAELLSEQETSQLKEQMADLTAYGNVAYRSTVSCGNTARGAEHIYRELFGTNSGTLFFIDMDNRMIYIFSDGDMYKVLTKGYANTITDNVYKYASKGEFYTCASQAFEQERNLFLGYGISQPMKYVSNLLLALLLAMLINYFIVRFFASAKKVADEELLGGVFEQQMASNFSATFTHKTKKYSPQSSGSGGGHSGGGHSGGGGGHSF